MFLQPDAGLRDVVFTAPPSMPECMSLPTLVTQDDGRVVSQWKPTTDELDALLRGQPVTIVIHSAGVVNPIAVGVGGFDLR
jgi:hypothetical protein